VKAKMKIGGLWSVVCGLWSVVCGLWSVGSGVQDQEMAAKL